ncbi:MAG: DUF4058 family protein [Planctomycetes bacterium]|nr:DUF4058 family protein [Planctomycetota bacterium]
MSSPFSGMDPYLEGHLWPDVHHGLAYAIRRQIVPRIRGRYVARIEVSLIEDPTPEAEIGILYPDVEVLAPREPTHPTPGTLPSHHEPEATTAPLTIPAMETIEVRIPSVEIRDLAGDRLVTSIEILPPVNKREPGLSAYRKKRQRLRRSSVHLLEIDFLRRGTRAIIHPRIPATTHLCSLTRAGSATTDLWPLPLGDPLPCLPVPLLAPDPDVILDLGAALAVVYDDAAYEDTIDYRVAPPPPELTQEEARRVDGSLRAAGRR